MHSALVRSQLRLFRYGRPQPLPLTSSLIGPTPHLLGLSAGSQACIKQAKRRQKHILVARSELRGSLRSLACAGSLAATRRPRGCRVHIAVCSPSSVRISVITISISNTHRHTHTRRHTSLSHLQLYQTTPELKLFWSAIPVGRACHPHLKLTTPTATSRRGLEPNLDSSVLSITALASSVSIIF